MVATALRRSDLHRDRAPRLADYRPADLRIALVLGLMTGTMTLFFLAAIDRIPWARRSRSVPGAVGRGGLPVREPPQPDLARHRTRRRAPADRALDRRHRLGRGALRGHRGDGLGRIHPADAGGRRPLQWDRWARDHDPIAALATTFIGLPQAVGNITPWVVVQAIGLALLLPVIPFTLELQALRRLTTAAFGTLMALEPAVATMWGVVLLAQIPQAAQFLGVVLVVIAGIGAERSGRRTPIPATPMA